MSYEIVATRPYYFCHEKILPPFKDAFKLKRFYCDAVLLDKRK